MKDRASSNLNTLNRIGGEQIGQISHYQLKPLIFNQFGYYISAITQRSAGAQYTDELFTATLREINNLSMTLLTLLKQAYTTDFTIQYNSD